MPTPESLSDLTSGQEKPPRGPVLSPESQKEVIDFANKIARNTPVTKKDLQDLRRTILEPVEKTEAAYRELTAWAETIQRDQDWVKENLTYDPSTNTWETKGDFDLLHLQTLASFPENIVKVNGDLWLANLTSAEHLHLPSHIGGSLRLDSLTSAEHLHLPSHIGGYLGLRNLTSAEHLHLPSYIGGGLYLSNLTSAEHLHLPDHIGGYLDLRSLTSAEHLHLPSYIGGGLYLSSLTSGEHLHLPSHIGGHLDLQRLTSGDRLEFKGEIEGDIYFRQLSLVKLEELRKKFPQYAGKIMK